MTAGINAGCIEGQGYYFGRPQPHADIQHYFAPALEKATVE